MQTANKIRDTYNRLGTADIPDHEKCGCTRDDYDLRKAEFRRRIQQITGSMSRIPRQSTSGSWLNPVVKVLDVGCGNGAFTRCVSDISFCEVSAIDSSVSLIGEMHERHPSISGHVASCYALPFEPYTFDVVYSLGLLQLLDNPMLFAHNLISVLKPGGIGLVEFLPRWRLRDVLARIPVRLCRGDWRGAKANFAYLHKTEGWRGITINRWRPHDVCRLLRDAGAKDARCISDRWGLHDHHAWVRFTKPS